MIWDSLIKEHLPPEIVDRKNDSELAIYYKNGSIQRFVGSEDPDKHRGVNAIDVVFDEYSEQQEEIWTAIFQPILRENGGTATFIFTPKGKNHAWNLLQSAKSNEEWFVSVLGVKDTEVFTKEELEEIKRNTPQALYEQEYECKFVDGATQVFRRIRENLWEGELVVAEGKLFQIGVDLAKYQDWTVITPFDLHTFQVGKQDRFNQVDWVLQEAKIEAMAGRYKSSADTNPKIIVDSTGVGDPIYENLQRKGLNVEGYQFTEQSRNALLTNLAILLEKDKIKLPNDEGLIEELEACQYVVRERGKIAMVWPESKTKDRVMSLALSVWGAVEKLPHYTVKRTSGEFGQEDDIPQVRFHY